MFSSAKFCDTQNTRFDKTDTPPIDTIYQYSEPGVVCGISRQFKRTQIYIHHAEHLQRIFLTRVCPNLKFIWKKILEILEFKINDRDKI